MLVLGTPEAPCSDAHAIEPLSRRIVVSPGAMRVSVAADDERRRIERDLHDGAQQRLIALRIRLGLAEETLDEHPEIAALLSRFGDEVQEIIDEVREIARGVYPGYLAAHGLESALRAAAVHAARPVSVRARGVGRYSPTLERAVYFACLEALQNAVKHGDAATTMTVHLCGDGSRLRFSVRDDGPGFDVAADHGGTGLASMAARLASVGGTLEVRSRPGRGTRVSGRIPLRRAQRTQGPPDGRQSVVPQRGPGFKSRRADPAGSWP